MAGPTPSDDDPWAGAPRRRGHRLPGLLAQATALGGPALVTSGPVGIAAAALCSPGLRQLLRRPATHAGGERLRLLSWNVEAANDPAAVIAAVQSEPADVAALFELTTAMLAALRTAGIPDALSCTGRSARGRWPPDYFGIAVLGPVEGVVHRIEATCAVRAELPIAGVDGRPAVLWAIRPTAPICSWRVASWRAFWSEFDRRVTAEGPARALVVCGDLNTTIWHRPLQDLARRHGLRSARSGALGGTWRHPVLGWRATLDHVLVRGLAVGCAGLADAHGSDHRPVVVDLEGWPLA